MPIYRAHGRLVWPVRPNVEKVSRVVELGGSYFVASLEFPSTYFVAHSLKLANMNWCQVTVSWRQRFAGSTKQARSWAKTKNGGDQLLRNVERVQHAFIDVLKNELSDNYDVHCIRHFGPLDWPYYQIDFAGARVKERIGSSLGTHFRSIPTELDSLPDICMQISFEQRTLQRAIDLSQCGYPTESVLLAAAVLDASVQKILHNLMQEKQIQADSAKQLLRNVMTKRMVTYLDAVLKLASGHSLFEENPDLFKKMVKVNADRNDAIHNGKELTRADAYDACRVAYEVITYLCSIKPGIIPTINSPTFFA
jgi:hypothetical protein